MALLTIGLCAGTGMLDEGLRAGCEFLGIEQRTVCYVEREAYAASQLVKNMEAGALDAAPVWSDLTTFNGAAWRRKVHFITAGFPCQPHSVAGARKGTEDERWLWQDILRIIRDVAPGCVFLENVRGLLSSGGFTAVVGSLVALGFNIEWGVLAASEVGAAHQRERVFILAYRHDINGLWSGNRRQKGRAESANSGGVMANSYGLWQSQPQRPKQDIGRWIGDRREKLADTSNSGLQGRELCRTLDEWDGALASGSTAELCGTHIFAEGPESERWGSIIAEQHWLAPATEPGVCMSFDGLAYMVDASRSDQLRACGNGVVPLQAAIAFVLLARRAGIV